MTPYERFAARLRRQTAGFFPLQDSQAQVLFAHYELMLKWNRRLNLTRIVDLEEAVDRHYAEALFLAARLPEDVVTLADLGSGAGFPGFPIAVALPHLRVTLVESDQRKAAFLRETRDLTPNLEVLAVRAEALDRSFDAITARAVRPEDVLLVARKSAQWAGLLLSEADAARLNWPQSRIEPLPFGHGGALWTAHVPRET